MRGLLGLVIAFGIVVPHSQGAGAQQVPDLILQGEFDPATTSIAEALDRTLALDLANAWAYYAVRLAADSGDPAYLPRLKQVAELYGTNSAWYDLVVQALDAIWRMGGTEAYFLGLARLGVEAPALSEAAIHVMGRAPREELVPMLDSILVAVVASDVEPYLRSGFRTTVEGYMHRIETVDELEQEPLPVELGVLSEYLLGALSSTSFADDGTFVIHRGDVYGDLDPNTRWAEQRLVQLARTHPSITEVFVDSLSENAELLERYAEQGPAAAGAAFEVYVRSQAFPNGFPAPPAVADSTSDVVPLLNCVTENGDGTLTAHFAYNNRSGRPVTYPYGELNRLAPAAYDGEQPEVFLALGRTPVAPGYAFRVRFDSTAEVLWSLNGRTKGADAASPRCPASPQGVLDPDIVPLVGCVFVNEDESVTVFFGYDNLEGLPLDVPVGDDNRIEYTRPEPEPGSIPFPGSEPEVMVPDPPESFGPGRTEPDVRKFYKVPYVEEATWHLLGRTATGNNDSLHCSDI